MNNINNRTGYCPFSVRLGRAIHFYRNPMQNYYKLFKYARFLAEKFSLSSLKRDFC